MRRILSLAVAAAVATRLAVPAIVRAAPFDVLDTAQDGVEAVESLNGARAVAVSPNGAHVYVAAAVEGAVTGFAVDPASGALTPVGAIVDGGNGDGLLGCVDLAVSPDGRHVYAAGFGDDAVAILSRDTASGALGFVDAFFNAELPAGGLDGASGVAVSPDGQHVYATAGVADAVVAFSRAGDTGLLTWLETEAGDPLLDGAVDLAISPDGTRLYVLAQGVTADVPADALLTYARDPASGLLTRVDAERDLENGVQGLTFPNAVVVAPEGNHIYTVAGFAGMQGVIPGKLSIFLRSAVDASTSYFTLYGDDANGIDGLAYAIGVTVAADGRWLYAVGAADDALAIFARDPFTGLLSFDRALRDDADGSRLLDGAIDVAADPLGRFVYVVALNEDSLTVFAPEPGAAAGAALLALAALAAHRRRTGVR